MSSAESSVALPDTDESSTSWGDFYLELGAGTGCCAFAGGFADRLHDEGDFLQRFLTAGFRDFRRDNKKVSGIKDRRPDSSHS